MEGEWKDPPHADELRRAIGQPHQRGRSATVGDGH
jgi:hypothetical protein